MKIRTIVKDVTRCISLSLTPLALAISQAYAQTALPSASELRTLRSADSTQITPRLGTTPAPTPTAPPTTFGNNSLSVPLRTAYNCSSYRGQYDIDSQAVGTFYITRENNPYLPNYGQILSTDNSGCYQPCSTRNQTSTSSCSSVYGSGWTGNITYNTYYSCTAGGYQQAQSPTYVSDTCVAPPPPPPPCSNTSTNRSKTCRSEYGSDWTGRIYYVTPYICNSSGVLVAQPEEYVRDTCNYNPAPTPAPTVPPPVTPTPVPITPTPGIIGPVTPAPVIPAPVPVTPAPVIPAPVPVTPAPVIPAPVPVTPAPVIPTPVPVPVPEPAGCETTMGYVGYGAIKSACTIWGYAGAYPRGENYRCTTGGWALNNAGNSMYMDYCE